MRYLIALGLCLLVTCSDQPLPSWEARIDAFISSELTAKEIPALSITIVDGDQVAWTKGYGQAASEMPATSQTVYRVASVSKLFTALAVMQLVEDSLLSLDEPITPWLPDFAPNNPYDAPITLRQLLSHRSGLVREPPVGHYFDDTSPTLFETVRSLNSSRLISEPGKRTKYSNAAVSLAGYILSQAADMPFNEFVQTRLIDPMGLEHTSFVPREDLRNNLGVGYMWRYDTTELTEAPVFELGIGPAGNLYTTTEDLGKFIHTLFAIERDERPDLLSAKSLQEMWTVQFSDNPSGFGIGFHVSDHNGLLRIGHAGMIYGYSTRVYALPDQEIGVAVVANLDAVNPVVDRIAAYALDVVLASKNASPLPTRPVYATVDSMTARAVDGAYGEDIVLIERNGKLWLEKEPVRVAVREDENVYVTDGRLGHGYYFSVSNDTLKSSDGRFGRRSPHRPMPPPAEQQGLIGEYGWDHNVLYIYESNGELHALIEWFFEYPLKRIADDLYRFPYNSLYAEETIRFVRDDRGRATEANLEGIVFERRNIEPEEGAVFKIVPRAPIDSLRRRAMAATPPDEEGVFKDVDLVDLTSLDKTIKLDIRYATRNNFMDEVFYTQTRAFLQRPAAQALLSAHKSLNQLGYGLVVYDGYRPWYVTKMFYDATPDNLRHFVANPANGSRHNRGCAVDIGLYHLSSGEIATSVSGYDEFTSRAYPDYPGGTSEARYHRELLRDVMEEAGFTVYEAEWWHFDFKEWHHYPIVNRKFENLN